MECPGRTIFSHGFAMANRNALYLTIAHRCAAQGETGRAIITIVNALTNNPQFLETQPEAVEFLAEILIPGFEEEIHKLESRHPSFGFKIYDALVRHGKPELARKLEQSFGAYCIERMKTVHAPEIHEHSAVSEPDKSWFERPVGVLGQSETVSTTFHAGPEMSSDNPMPLDVAQAMYELMPQDSGDTRTPEIAGIFEESLSVHDVQLMPEPSAEGRPPEAPYTRLYPSDASNHFFSRSSVQREKVIRSGTQLRSLRSSHAEQDGLNALARLAGCAPESASMPTAAEHSPEPSMSLNALPDDVWISTMRRHQTRYAGQTMAEKHEFTSQNTDAVSSEGMRRFDRIRTHQNVETANDYADNAASRVIIDFDNTIRETPKSAMFETTLTKCRTFAEDLAEIRASEASRPSIRRVSTSAHTPLEAVAETTHDLSETPSVEPYAVRHPRRFELTPQQMVTCVACCLLCVFGIITWQSTAPAIEKRVIEGVSESYIAAAEAGEIQPLAQVNRHHRFVSDAWMKSYELFLEVWKSQHFKTDTSVELNPESEDFPRDFSAAHAAYLMQVIERQEYAHARSYFESVDQGIWREHPYFRTWSEALLDEAAGDLRTAAAKYEKLLHSPLAPFATVQLGMLALDEGIHHNDLKQRFIQALKKSHAVPANAWCAYDVIQRGQTTPGLTRSDVSCQANLKSPYAEYCAIGDIFRSIHNNQAVSKNQLQLLKTSSALTRAEDARLEAIVEAELYLHHPEQAVAFYREMDLPAHHPQRTRLRHAILQKAAYFGDWSSLHGLNSEIPLDIDYMTAAHLIDQSSNRDLTLPQSPLWSTYLLQFHGKRPGKAVDLMDEAWQEAEQGRFNRAISLTRSVLSANPSWREPLYLQAWILSQAGQGENAAAILEQSMMTGNGTAPLIVLSNLYRARAHLPLNYSAFALPFLKFDDPVLESSRCEVFWRTGDRRASACLEGLDSKKLSKSAWFMKHINAKGQPTGKSTQWSKLSSGAMSIPGFELAYARKLLSEGQINAAIRAYTRAILQDSSTATPQTVFELERLFISHKRRYEGTRKFEEIIETAVRLKRSPSLLGSLHLAVARIYQPEAAHSMARRHLGSAIDYLGETPEIIELIVRYYEAKDKPIQTRMWQNKLKKFHD